MSGVGPRGGGRGSRDAVQALPTPKPLGMGGLDDNRALSGSPRASDVGGHQPDPRPSQTPHPQGWCVSSLPSFPVFGQGLWDPPGVRPSRADGGGKGCSVEPLTLVCVGWGKKEFSPELGARGRRSRLPPPPCRHGSGRGDHTGVLHWGLYGRPLPPTTSLRRGPSAPRIRPRLPPQFARLARSI